MVNVNFYISWSIISLAMNILKVLPCSFQKIILVVFVILKHVIILWAILRKALVGGNWTRVEEMGSHAQTLAWYFGSPAFFKDNTNIFAFLYKVIANRKMYNVSFQLRISAFFILLWIHSFLSHTGTSSEDEE